MSNMKNEMIAKLEAIEPTVRAWIAATTILAEYDEETWAWEALTEIQEAWMRGESGTYEMSKFETKSGRAEVLSVGQI